MGRVAIQSLLCGALFGCGATPGRGGSPAAEAAHDSGRALDLQGAREVDAADAAVDAADPPTAVIDEGRLPLSTCGRWIVDRARRRVKLASVNWYGASDVRHVVGGLDRLTLARLAGTIRTLGFNSVRLPFSNEMLRAPA